MSNLDFNEESVADRAERRRHARKQAGQMRLLIGVVLFGVLLIGGILGYRFIWVPKVDKAKELEQRKLYEKYQRVSSDVFIPTGSPSYPEPSEDDKDWRKKYEAAKKKYEAEQRAAEEMHVADRARRMKEVEDESRRRWGKHPLDFADLPPSSDHHYYRD